MEIKLKTSTPVHVGTGNLYGRVEYFTREGRVIRISFNDLYQRLNENERNYTLSVFDNISNISDQISELSEEIKEAKNNRNKNIEDKKRNEKKKKEQEYKNTSIELQRFFAKFEDTRMIYSCEVSNIDSLNDDLRGEIREQIKTNNIPYVPGSSIKGAIRTALLWRYLKNKKWETTICYKYKDKKGKIEIKGKTEIDLFNLMKNGGGEFLDNEKFYIAKLFKDRGNNERKDFADRFISLVFNLGPFTFDEKYKNYKPNDDAKYDILKFLHVSDFMPVDHKLEIDNVKTYSLDNRANKLVPKGFNNFVEAISGSFDGTISLSPQIKVALENDKEYPLLHDKLEILGLNAMDLTEETMIRYIKETLTEFNKCAIGKEVKLCEKASNNKDFINALNGIDTKNSIRVGFSVGTTYQTLIKMIEERDIDLAKDIVNELRLGKFTRNIDRDNKNRLFPPYPKSIEFTEKVEPLGWLKFG